MTKPALLRDVQPSANKILTAKQRETNVKIPSEVSIRSRTLKKNLDFCYSAAVANTVTLDMSDSKFASITDIS